MDRRRMLQGTIGGLVGVSLDRLARAAAPGAVPENAARPSTQRLNGRMAVVSGVGCNVVTLATSDGLLLVDSGGPGDTRTLLRELDGLHAGRRVHTLFNTHWHPLQTGSNEALGKAGAKIIAHDKTRLWLSTPHYDPAIDRYQKAYPKAAWPTEVFFSTGRMSAGGEEIDYGYLREAHTDADIYVYFRGSNVLAVGHAASPWQDPQLDWYSGGWLGGRIDALSHLHQLADDRTAIVPAVGPVVSRSAVKAEHDLLLAVYTRMVKLMLKGYSANDMIEAGVMTGLARSWSDPATFVRDAYHGLWAHHDALSPTMV
jgi:glyoxylase-like metal-dependent hydrolase (beta-lactamase superfamily II)